MELREHIRTISDFPKQGVLFKDITPLLANKKAFRQCVDEIVEHYLTKGIHFDKVVSAESRGFIFGSVLAYEFHAGFVPLRKPGKLPCSCIREEFKTEYSTDAFEMHADALRPEESVLVVDDIIASGGTLEAAARLVERSGAKVEGICCVIELPFLGGKEKIKKYDFFSLFSFEKGE
ncbi:MAG: adenine phosphoribosyltransferase [Candidatus Diapherotrites archaeon]|uniref:Adenine phosphoribosyltransferase n=1 Tax=Candidatus Iainarchaeum sp. TaxID=3101447 RepID=A0A8T4L2B0_9ARCH|nr:adenine phosphoribosyltransferase [Candidatus Diapherotrites archaeon]